MNEIDIDRGERKICRNCVDEIRVRGKSETLKKAGDITVYGTDESEEDKEEEDGTVIEGWGDEVSVIPIVYPHGTFSVSSLGYFFLLVHNLNLLFLTFLSLSHSTPYSRVFQE